MQRILAGVSTVVVSAIALVGCDRLQTPSRPTEALTPAITVALQFSPAAVVAWPCFARPPFVSPDCAASSAALRPTSVRAAALAPPQPLNLASTVTGSTVVLQWIAAVDGDAPTSYVVEAGSAPGLANLANFDTGNSGQMLTVQGVPAGTYFVRVRARNDGGVSGPSNEISVIVAAAGCPSAPNAPSSLIVSTMGTAVSFTW